MKTITPLYFKLRDPIRTLIDNIHYSQKTVERLSSQHLFFIQIGSNDGGSQDSWVFRN